MNVLVLDESYPTARKTHRCETCCGTIGVGDTYMRQRNIGDDGPYTFKSHLLGWKLSLHIERLRAALLDEIRQALVEIFAGLALGSTDGQ